MSIYCPIWNIPCDDERCELSGCTEEFIRRECADQLQHLRDLHRHIEMFLRIKSAARDVAHCEEFNGVGKNPETRAAWRRLHESLFEFDFYDTGKHGRIHAEKLVASFIAPLDIQENVGPFGLDQGRCPKCGGIAWAGYTRYDERTEYPEMDGSFTCANPNCDYRYLGRQDETDGKI